jgi:NADH-quinone oxidoreductase subunit A
MGHWLLLPPICFALLCLTVLGLQAAAGSLAAHGDDAPGKRKPYSCGEDMLKNRAQPSYDEFFPVAFFFTIMHVVVLILATVPPHGISKFLGIVIFYLVAAGSGVFILFGEKIERDLGRLLRILMEVVASRGGR